MSLYIIIIVIVIIVIIVSCTQLFSALFGFYRTYVKLEILFGNIETVTDRMRFVLRVL